MQDHVRRHRFAASIADRLLEPTFPFWRRVVSLAFIIAAGGALGLVETRAAELSEYELKAVYLYNFTQFVTWPEGVVTKGQPIVIGIVGEDPFGDSLDQLMRAGGPDTPTIVVKRLTAFDQLDACQILFVSKSERRSLGRILQAIDGKPILTVGDDDSFALRGCVIGFYLDKGTVRIVVNENAAARSGLALSSKLLRVARTR